MFFNYDIDCKAVDSKTNKPILFFKAREYTEQRASGSYVSGGIASYGQSYAVITACSNVKELKPLNHIIIIDNARFRIVSIRKYNAGNIGRTYRGLGGGKEYIIEME